MTDYALDVFYYAGRTFVPGDEIEPNDAADRKSLEDRNMIGKERPATASAGQVPEPVKSGRPAPENKGDRAAPENKTKP